MQSSSSTSSFSEPGAANQCGSVRAVVITLRRSNSRTANVQAIRESCPLECGIWDATDGSILEADFVDSVYRKNLHRPEYPFELRRGEVGCYLSHRSIWKMMVEQSIDRMLVLEDDVAFLPNFPDTLRYAVENASDGSYVQFQVRNLQLGNLEAGSQVATLFRPTLAPLRTSAQLVTLAAARRLLDFSEQFDRPVDVAIQMTWLHGATVLVALPQSVIEVSANLGGSTISAQKKRRPLLATIQREWLRARYRHNIARYARQYSRFQSSTIDAKKSA